MVNITTLLPVLRTLVAELAEDLLARSTADAKIDAGLREAFQQIEKGGRTAQAFEVWRDDYLDQVAVAWVLACVFVRFMEDNRLIDDCWLAGEGDRRKLAEGTHELFFRKHPHDTDREYFEHVFREVGKIPAAKELFAEGKTPLWAVGPSGDAAMKLLAFWREIDAEEGHLLRSFNVKDGDTRFLGDLYQDLSEKARKKFALLQTPVFVEEFILDRTLTPALDEFGLEKVRLIDPTCGSGHFLLGAFARLFRLWLKRESNEIVAAQKALDGVWGVDINPFAVAIARFRLIVAAVQACGIKRLKQAPGWTIHLATGDSLLWGCKPGYKSERVPLDRQGNLFEVDPIYAVEDREAVHQILGQGYHVVVGNPPYITVKDKAQNEAYRSLYSTCHRKYSLSVPFAQRFWELAIQTGEDNGGCGFIGQITANSFMKREFGTKLIEEFFPKIDLTHVIDTSGAYIPGHGTPTVILFGRARKPVGETVRAVLGIKGEPATPEDASQGLVWQSIVKQIDTANAQDAFTSTADVPRTTFAGHPWSIGGGGAADLMESIEDSAASTLSDVVDLVGVFGMTNADEVFLADQRAFTRKQVESGFLRQLQLGDEIRDWSAETVNFSIFPYKPDESLAKLADAPYLHRWLWPARTVLGNRATFGKGTYFSEGLAWWKWHQITQDRLQTPLSIAFAFVASHNHFVLDRGGKVFNRTAPIIKLPADATEDDHLGLLGLLNSSTACFWMKQVSQQKQMTGGDGVRVTTRAAVPYEFAGTQLQNLPIPASFQEGLLRERLRAAAQRIDELAQQTQERTAKQAIAKGIGQGGNAIVQFFELFMKERTAYRSEMVFLQEEIDFICYVMFGLADSSLLSQGWQQSSVLLDAGMRPFEIMQQRNIDDFEVPSALPDSWPSDLRDLWKRRIQTILNSRELRLIEDDHYKRRWRGRQGLFNHTERKDELANACENWLLDRLEDRRYWPGVELQTTARLADRASGDAEFMQVATLYRGRSDFDVSALVAELVEGESVPFLPILRYKTTGLRKRQLWERTWDLQRQEDAGKSVGDIPVPPKYTSADFQKTDYWRLRGKLDVSKERWISYPHCSTENDTSLVVAWAGWDHLQQATALIAYYDARKREGWTPQRLTPLLAGLDQLLPWIHQWHLEIDTEFGETAGKSFQTMLEHDAHELGLTLEEVRNWQPPAKAKKGRKKKETEDDE